MISLGGGRTAAPTFFPSAIVLTSGYNVGTGRRGRVWGGGGFFRKYQEPMKKVGAAGGGKVGRRRGKKLPVFGLFFTV